MRNNERNHITFEVLSNEQDDLYFCKVTQSKAQVTNYGANTRIRERVVMHNTTIHIIVICL